jgi:hypothetical protein
MPLLGVTLGAMERLRAIVVAASALAIWLAGAVPSPAPASGASPDPFLCTASETRKLVTSFVHAFNTGDARTLNRLWARRPDFRWYTASQSEPRIKHSVFVRDRLVPYFARRHRQGERLRIVRFRFNGNGGYHGHFEYRIQRTARDLTSAKTMYDGKGAVVCFPKPRALAVWSMGTT